MNLDRHGCKLHLDWYSEHSTVRSYCNCSYCRQAQSNDDVKWIRLQKKQQDFNVKCWNKAAGRKTRGGTWTQWNERVATDKSENHDISIVLMTDLVTYNLWWQKRPSLLHGGELLCGRCWHSENEKLIRFIVYVLFFFSYLWWSMQWNFPIPSIPVYGITPQDTWCFLTCLTVTHSAGLVKVTGIYLSGVSLGVDRSPPFSHVSYLYDILH